MKYGYMNPSSEVSTRSAQLMSQDSLKNYIMEFQSFAGLPQTGDLDEETVIMINKPRCGVKDIVGKSSSMRKKRYALQVRLVYSTDDNQCLTFRVRDGKSNS